MQPIARKHVIAAAVVSLTALAAAPVLAEGEPFAIRFGLVGVYPTTDTDIGTTQIDLNDSYGGEFDFEWYFAERWGLEGSIATGVDADVDVDDSGSNDITTATGLTITPVTVGLNWHAARSEQVDWYIGVLAGPIYYGNFDVTSVDSTKGSTTTTSDIDTDDDVTYGVQTAVDLAVTKNGRWAINVGLKYLLAEADSEILEQGAPLVREKIEIDPLLLRVMGVFRFGS